MASTANTMVTKAPARLRSVRIRRGSRGLATRLWTNTNAASRTAEAISGPMTRGELHPTVAASPNP